MPFFCPLYCKWFEYVSYGDLNHRQTLSPEDLVTEESGQTIIDLWNIVSPPPKPILTPIVVNTTTSALLILDMENSICKSPRCIDSISKIRNLLTRARKNNMLVVYSLIPTGNPEDIVSELAPLPGEPIVKSNVDKFYKTNLDQILQEKGIKTVIVTGYAANGAVLHTATSAAFRGYKVIVPVDCMSTANILYAEQYTAWHMLNSPGTRGSALLTKTSYMDF